MYPITAGEELKFGQVGKSVRLQTNSDSIRCQIEGQNNEIKKYLATRSGFLSAESEMINMTRSGKKSESKMKKDKMSVDIIPFHSSKYFPQENDTVIGIVQSKNMEFFTVDIGSDSPA